MTSEFSFTHDDFSLDGLFAICDELLIEIEVNIHGEYSVACVDRMDRGFAVPVPVVISDYVSAWALTDAGKAVIRKAHEDHQWQFENESARFHVEPPVDLSLIGRRAA